jgi:putative SOS response-associated peptidase YedK
MPMPIPEDYARWLGDEPDPRDLMRPFPAEPMRMWPISTRVNKPENDDPSVVQPIELICPNLRHKSLGAAGAIP